MKKLSEDHYIVMDDSEPEIGDWVYSMDGIHQWFGQVLKTEPLPKKITHSTNIDWNEVYYIPLSEVKELLGEVDVEKKAKERYTEKDFAPGEILIRKIAWINGYNQALEDNKVKWFTREDIMKAFTQGKYEGVNMTMVESEDYIQSLQTKTEWDVEFVDGKLKLKS